MRTGADAPASGRRSGPSSAPQDTSAERRYEQALEAMQADLADPERSFEFVQAAVAVGDLRGAIAALERILLIDPKLANIKLELGVLYLRLGNPQLAQNYLNQALEAPDVPELVRERAEEMLARAEAAASRHRFSGLLSLAGRFDTNANAAPAAVRLFDPIVGVVEATLQEEFTEREDYSMQALGSLQYGYRLDSQAGHEIEANLLLYAQRYDVSNEVNTTLIDFDLGPRFYFGDIVSQDLSLRPYVTVSYLQLDDESYLRTVGGGIGVRKYFSPRLRAEGYVEAEDFEFSDSERRPTVSKRSGPQVALGGVLSYQLFTNTLLTAALTLAAIDAEEEFESFKDLAFVFSLAQYYPAPFGLTRLPWSTALSARVRQSWYDEPDPTIDPNTTRDDTRQDDILSTNIPLSRSWTVVLSAQYTENNSSLPNNTFDNVSGSMGVSWRF